MAYDEPDEAEAYTPSEVAEIREDLREIIQIAHEALAETPDDGIALVDALDLIAEIAGAEDANG